MDDTGSRTSQSGQTLVLITVFMLALLGMCALAIDVGSWYQQKRSLQNGADAGALAGAAGLPVSWATAASAAAGEFGKNVTGGSLSYQQATTYRSGDSILVTASRPSPSFFAKAFGKNSITIKATAKATVVNAGGGALPWGVMQKPYTPGATYPIYVDNSGPNNGSISLPAWNGSSCSLASGASLYRAEIDGSAGTCVVDLNDVIDVKSGQNTGPTTQGVSDRCNGLQPASSVVSFTANGTPTILQPASCQLVLLPTVLDNATSQPIWPGGGGKVKVVGFSWWVIIAVLNGGKEVDAVYVGDAPTDPFSGGPLSGAYTAQLTG
jgi:Flp pilus assembly protein TadG